MPRLPSRTRCFCSLLILSIAALVGAVPTHASVTASISGTVSDSTGAVIPGVTVVAVNVQTNVSNETQSNAIGYYTFPVLPVGRYEVDARHSGFKDYRQTDLVLDVNSAREVNITLEVGQSTQNVNVSANTVQVETTNTQMGEVIGSSKMTTLPLNGRSYTDLLALQPGVVPVSSGEYNSNAVSGSLNAGNLSVNGQRESSNGFMVNGGDVEEGEYRGTAIIPNLDSIAEFRIITNNYDAEYGNFTGGQINAITKSGTNQFHGDVFEFLRATGLDARTFFSPGRGAYNQNQFGGTFGGPILRNKLFFFGDYQGTRQTVGVPSGLIPVPSASDRQGNLSDLAGKLTGSVDGTYWANSLSQELGYPVSPGEPYYYTGCSSNSGPSPCVLPNAMVPQAAFSAPSMALMKYIPTANSGSYFTTSASDQSLRDDKWSFRADADTSWGMISGYYFWDDYSENSPYPFATVPGFNAITPGRAQMFNLSDTKTFGGNTVNELRLYYIRNTITFGKPVGGVGPTLSSLGFPSGGLGIVPLAPQFEGVPPVVFNSFTIGTEPFVNSKYNNTYQLIDNVSKVIGTHTLKFGGSAHYDQLTAKDFFCNNGYFDFSGSETGSDFSDFVLGAPTYFLQGQFQAQNVHTRYLGIYGQDSWRAKRSVTVNAGLRWEFSNPWYEIHNQNSTLVPGVQSKVFPGAPTGLVFPGDPGIPSTISATHYNNFAPRIGLAYAPQSSSRLWRRVLGGPGEFSVRGGFGVFFTSIEGVTQLADAAPAPYGFFYASSAPPSFATPYLTRTTGQSAGQRFPVPAPPGNVSASNPDSSVNWAQFEPLTAGGVFPSNRLPYSENYDLSLERQLGSSTMVSVSYVGTQAHRLPAALAANPSNPAACLSVSQASEVVSGTGTCGPFSETGTFYPTAGGTVVPRQPFGADFAATAWFATMANSNYNSLQVSVRHETGRMEFLMGYTYSKSLDNASGWGGGADMINPLNYRSTKALSAFDLTHNFVASYGYHLPFDKLFRPNRLTNGWVISGVTRFSTGLPVFMNEPDDNSLLGTYQPFTAGSVDIPNFVPGNLTITNPRKADPTTGANPYFNTSLFSKENLGQLGNSSRRFFHGPGINNFDLALMKDLRLTESKQFEFRAEFFDVFNHAQFMAPVGNIDSSAFGFVTNENTARIGQIAAKFLF